MQMNINLKYHTRRKSHFIESVSVCKAMTTVIPQ